MIQDMRQIRIESSPERIFECIAKMPNKFPVWRILETKPFLFPRLLLVDGFRAAMEAVRVEKPDDAVTLNVGDSMGPFTLTDSVRPFRHWFTLESMFFKCRTGYTIRTQGGITTLNFDIIAENPGFLERENHTPHCRQKDSLPS
jgi:hypothetical protein